MKNKVIKREKDGDEMSYFQSIENTRTYVFENFDPKFDMYNTLLKANHLLGDL